MLKHLVVVGCWALAACSASGSDSARTQAGASNGGGSAVQPPGSENGGGSLQLAPGPASGGAADTSCAAESQEAHPVPTDLLVLLDQSGSMTLEGNRWDPTAAALKAFVQNPASAGVGVGLAYFPLGAQKTEDPAICQAANYLNPDVPVNQLPANAAALTSSIDAHHFTAAEGEDAAHWGTPTRPAVEGALAYLNGYQALHPDRRLYLLLATDGQPSKLCPGNNIEGIALALAAAATQATPILTFVIGIGELANLNDLAEAGGTGHPAFIVDAGGTGTEAQLSAALDAIRHTALPCEFAIPTPSNGRIDPAQVNVEFSADGGKSVFPNVASIAACTSAEATWYYDDPAAPTKVIMCPTACDKLKAGNGRIDLLFGCKTVTK